MHVRKRNGSLEPVNLNKIVTSLERYCGDLPGVDVYRIATKTVGGLVEGVSTRELDMFSVRTAKDLIIDDPVYSRVAARILANLIQKEVSGQDIQSFSQSIEIGLHQGLIGPETHELVMANKRKLNAAIKHERDWHMEYHGLQTVYDRYLLKHRTLIALEDRGRKQRSVIETPQYFFLRVACGLAEDASEAIELYNLLSSLEYMCSTPTLFNSGTTHSQMSSCFVAGTEVLTVDDGVKPIEKIVIGDRVITHRGQPRKVQQVHRNRLGERVLYDIKCYGSPAITVTGNHRFWSISREQMDWGATTPTWNSIDYLRTGDWIAIPSWEGEVSDEKIDIAELLCHFPGNGGQTNYRYEVDAETIDTTSQWVRKDHLNNNPDGIAMNHRHNRISRFLRFDHDFAQFLGIWYGDGHVNRHRDSFGNQIIEGIGITAHKENVELIEFCRKIAREYFGIEASVYPSKDQNCVKIVFSSPLLGNVFDHLFGSYCDGKKLYRGCYRWTRSLFESLLVGLISSDGCVTAEGYVIISMANHGFIKGIYMVARSLGIPMTCRSAVSKKDPNHLDQWGLNVPVTTTILARVQKTYLDDRLLANKRGQSTSTTFINGVTFVRLNKKSVSERRDDTVYTLGVEEDHSYSIEGVICENCYLQDSPLDCLPDLYKKYADSALLSKFAGGIGMSLSRIRSKGSLIRGTNGKSNGIVPWAHTFSASVGAVDQGGRRKGAACVYLETHHPDLLQFLEMKDNTGEKEQRAYNLNLANWIPDLFMQRVKDDATWSFFDAVTAPELADLYGEAYEQRYAQLETEGKYVEQMPARKVYSRMMRTLAETGNGWMCFKDTSNRRGNQVNDEAGTMIHLSNLCVAAETLIMTDKGQQRISDLRDQAVNVWNGEEWSTVVVRHTGFQPLLHLVIDGTTLDCTPYHKFYVDGVHERCAIDLRPDDRLMRVAANGEQSTVHILEVQDNERTDDTFCFMEPKRHRGVFNGILAGNCTEILEVTSSGKRELLSREKMQQTTAADLIEKNIRLVGFDVQRDAFEVITGSECAVCNLGSINVGRGYVKHGKLDKEKLRKNVAIAVKYLDRVIDRNFYPIHEAEASNKRWRPVGLGLMGVADLFFQLRLPFESEQAIQLSAEIQEEIYFQALRTSCDLAKTLGKHRDFNLTRAAKGNLQFDLAGVTPSDPERWDGLRQDIVRNGLRNSLLIAIAPTATISHICGVEECTESIKSNLLKRETLSGEFIAINRYLVEDLRKIGRWTPDTITQLKVAEGSIATIADLPVEMYDLYKTVWEMSMKSIIAHGVARGAYIDQSHSLNMFIDLNKYPETKRIGVLSSLYMHAWESGLKTTYYFRSRSATRIEQTTTRSSVPVAQIAEENPEVCESCQ